MKILITGAAGYIGTELTRFLAAQSGVDELIVYDNLGRGNYNLFTGEKKPGANIRLVRKDILDSRSLKQHIDDVDIVYHLAAKVTTPFADHSPHLYDQVNNWGTAEVVYAFEDSPRASRFVYLSSASVYGASSDELDTSTHPSPRTFYGRSKLRGEHHVQRLIDEKRDAYIIRCGNVYGYSESMRFDSVINRFIFDAHFTGRLFIHGSGEQHRSFADISRVTDILAHLRSASLASGTYNLSELTLTINEVARTILEMYPESEFVFQDQNVAMRELKVQGNDELMALSSLEARTLADQLQDFRKSLAF